MSKDMKCKVTSAHPETQDETRGSFRLGKEEFLGLARKSRGCAKTYAGAGSRSSLAERRVTPGRKRTLSGRKLAILAISVFLPACMSAACVEAATSTAAVTVSVTIAPSSQLTLNDNSNDTNTRSGGNRRVPAAKNSVGATASVKTGSTPAILTVAAGNDYTDPIAGDTASASDTSGNLFLAAPAIGGEIASGAAGGEGCPASYSETFDWYLTRSWSCSPGKNTVTVTYTLTAP